MTHYILQVIFFQLSFLLVYEFLLKRETFFNYNRIYLLLTPIIALILPFLNFEILENVVSTEAFVILPEIIIGNPTELATKTLESSGEGFFETNWWLIAYFFGVAFNGFLFLKKYRTLTHLFKFKIISAEKEWKIIEVPQSKIACTFYNTVFLGDQISEEEKQQILSHELVHVKQKHSLDLLFFEIQKILFWFNPMVYVYQSKIASLHEFIADSQVIKSTEKKTYYQQMLNTAFGTKNISFINQFFNHSLIKKRIVMLQKSKSKQTAKLKYLLILPLMMLMLVYVACSDGTEQINLEQAEKSATPPPPPPPPAPPKDAKVLRVADMNNLTPAEEKKQEKLLELIKEENGTLIITDGKSSAMIEAGVKMEETSVPFTAIEQVPIYPGCEGLASNEEAKDCMTEKITEFVASNFKKKDMKSYVEKGTHKIYVSFQINKSGDVAHINAKASHPALQAEALRVVEALPRMTPGKQDGENVAVVYSLPIVFAVD
ncbi:MAG TPA: M56 family metallopeptidase [Salinimicrobium sp.]|nr:M56 family metallopeptidase [Salinimicrobium sp.]